MFFIKNTTPYIGKIKLKFEKYPYYSDKNSKLNSVILNLGFTKLVSRMYPNRSFSGWEVNKEKVTKICMYTGGTVRFYQWWEVIGPKGVHKVHTKPANKKDIVYHGSLDNSFMYGNNYIGNIETGWWYYKNRLVICDKYPKGVATKYKTSFWHSENRPIEDIEGIYGFSHRGGCLFRIGDRLFDETYHPHCCDYTKEQWKVWHDKYRIDLSKANGTDRDELTRDGVARYIPFTMRGKKVIETWDEAIEAAHNLSKYLS